MKLFKRLHVLATVGICSILYFGWILPSLDVSASIQKALSGRAVRVVVFGDNWSDTGSYRISPPSKDMVPIRTLEQGMPWTEVLCQELSCDYIDNFARTNPLATGHNGTGAVVSNAIMANATSQNSSSLQPLADLETQIQQWLKFENQKRLMPSRHFKDEWTIFTIFFGFWDLWQYSQLNKDDAVAAVDKTILKLFALLDTVAENTRVPVRIVLPLVVDITLMPGFQERSAVAKRKMFPHDQHRAIYLMEYWNTALIQVAAGWKGGKIYMPDLNKWVVDQLREHQLWRLGITDASGAGQQAPLFDEIETPCISPANSVLESGTTPSDTSSDASAYRACAQADRHLFWDEMDLGGQAHLSFGKEVVALIRNNQTINPWNQTDPAWNQTTSAESNGQNREIKSARFSLVLPPGS